MTILIRSDGAEARIEGDMEGRIRTAIGESSRHLVDLLEAQAEYIRRSAEAQWPIGRAGRFRQHSASRIRHYLRVSPGQIEGVVRSYAPYTRFIQSADAARSATDRYGAKKKAARTGAVVWTLMRWPARDEADWLVQHAAPLVQQALGIELGEASTGGAIQRATTYARRLRGMSRAFMSSHAQRVNEMHSRAPETKYWRQYLEGPRR